MILGEIVDTERFWRVRPEETARYGDAILASLSGLGIRAEDEGSPFVGPIIVAEGHTFGTMEGSWGFEHHPHDQETEQCGRWCRAGCTALDATRTEPRIVAKYVATILRGQEWTR